ncbi:MAG: SDR family oxidoreductase, partial [Planctomycetes bacterium]|nr:SDR family oxidoreductase [Planctomycetota bacterium]
MTKLIFGCGYLGRRVARRWLDDGAQVCAVTRSQDRAAVLAADGLRTIVADINDPRTVAELPAAETVLVAVGYDRQADRSIHDVYVGGLRTILDALPASIGRLIYISSTGVYGQGNDEWVDERSPCEPTREGGRAVLEAEELLRAHALGDRSIILRMAGLYGPGRIPRREDIAAGRPIAAPSDGYLNLIHVDDAADVVLLADGRAKLPSTYIVSDGRPVLRWEYFDALARLLDAPSPKFSATPHDAPAAQRAASSKRVRNRRLIEE